MAKEIGNVMPHDLQAERSVLGCCLLYSGALGIIAEEHLTATDFYAPAHRIIFNAIMAVHDAGDPVDLITLTGRLITMGDTEPIGGLEYVAGLTNVVPSPANTRHYCRIVKNKSQSREIITRCHRTVESATKSDKPNEISVEAAEALLNITRNTVDFTQSRILDDVIGQIDSEYEGLQNGTAEPPIKTGFKRLDELIQLQGGNVFVIAGLSNSGKTAMASGIAVNVSESGNHALWISSEMSHTEMTARFIGMATEAIPAREIRRKNWGYLKADPRISQNLRACLHQVYLPGGTEHEIKRIVTQAMMRFPIKLVVIDYIQRLTYSRSSGHEAQDMGKISGYLKRMSGETATPFIVLSQLSNPSYDRKSGESREPELYDLKWSGDIVNDADAVLFVHRMGGKDSDDEYYYKWLIRKNKHDSRAEIKAKFISKWVKFIEYPWSEK